MILFKGEHSGECTKYICKLHRKVLARQGIIAIPATQIAMLIVFVNWHPDFWRFTVPLILLGFAPCYYLVFRPIPKKEYANIMPTSVSILDDGTIVSKGQKFKHEIGVENVTEVVDHGTFYELYLNKAQNRGFFICEKALLKRGTIDEFEKTFKGKIVRKEETGKKA